MKARSLSRRGLVAGLAVAPLLSAPALAAGPHPDAALLAFAPSVEALIARSNRLERDLLAAEELIDEMTGPVPKDPRDAVFIGSGNQFRAAVDRYEADSADRGRRMAQVEARIGYDALTERCNAAFGEVVTAREQLAAMKATTMAGVLAKARVAEMAEWAGLDRSVVADLVALGGAA